MSSPESASGPAPLRRRGAERVVVVLAAAVLVLLVIGGIAAVVAMPVRRTIVYTFEVSGAGGAPADVYLGGKLVGPAPIALDQADLEPYLEPDFDPTTWPPPGSKGSSTSVSGSFRSECHSRGADPSKGDNDNFIYMKTVDAGRTSHAALKILVKAADGRIGVYCGGGSSSRSSWKWYWRNQRMSFRLEQPAGGGEDKPPTVDG